MSLKRNIIANYASQIYVTLLGISILPLYLEYMGAEAYGLVGFFTLLQAWFNILDIGLTPTAAREMARLRGGAIDAFSFRQLIRALELIFFFIALLGGGILFASSGFVAEHWLNANTLPLDEVQTALQLIAASVAMRWMAGLYRSCISGSEKLIWLSSFNSFFATLRFFGVLPILIWIDHSPITFFGYQLLIALIELITLVTKARQLFPKIRQGQNLGWTVSTLFRPVQPILHFSLNIALTSSAWVLVTQTDKLILSKLLSLSDYGYFTLAVLAANGIIMICNPISGALLPRMVRLNAENADGNLIKLYLNATRLTSLIATPACLILAFFPTQVLWAWTGDYFNSTQAAPILQLYAIGNGFLAMTALPYYLQFAKGDLKLHLIGSMLFLLFILPFLSWAAANYGSTGAGYVWAIFNALYFFMWIPIIHKKFSRTLQKKWLTIQILPTVTAGLLISLSIKKIDYWPQDRLWTAVFLCAIGASIPTFSLALQKIARR
jgi:O-antigen/teichoic acid export membrane protein